jgi:DNA-binding NtrC family response regulator
LTKKQVLSSSERPGLSEKYGMLSPDLSEKMGGNMKVLVIDDDPDVLEFLSAFFKNLGHTIVLKDSAKEGLKELVINQPDLVLLDIMMPDKDGLTVLKEIKEIDRDTPVAMITAYKDAERVIEAFRLGALDCLLKPFNIDYIINTVLPKVNVRSK